MSQYKPSDFPLLLEVFRDGLAYGLISKDEIVAWADEIIKAEDEPDYFFIELSLSPDTNSVTEVLDKYVSWSKNPLPLRVIFGVIYQKLITDVINLDTAITLTEQTQFYETLTPFEYGSIYQFEDYEMFYPPDTKELEDDVVKFLSLYKEFNLTNYDQWPEINKRVEEVLDIEQQKVDTINQEWRQAQRKKEAKRKLKRYAILGLPLLVIAGILIIDYISWQKSFATTFIDQGTPWLFYGNFFGAYIVLRFYYTIWRQKRRMR